MKILPPSKLKTKTAVRLCGGKQAFQLLHQHSKEARQLNLTEVQGVLQVRNRLPTQ